jgi:hypothetical protein
VAVDNFFSTYRKIFTIVFFANLTTLIVFVVRNNGWPLGQCFLQGDRRVWLLTSLSRFTAPEVGSAASANLMITILFRQENFVGHLSFDWICLTD